MTEKVREHRQEEKETNTGQQGRNKEDARRAQRQSIRWEIEKGKRKMVENTDQKEREQREGKMETRQKQKELKNKVQGEINRQRKKTERMTKRETRMRQKRKK